jgi:putative hydroxymethylpyrimidine transport system substrate-binding protein
MKSLRWAATLGSALLVVSGCGANAGQKAGAPADEKPGKELSKPASDPSKPARESTYLSVTLAGRQGPEDGGIEMAYQHGFFDMPGLEVGVASPLTPVRPIRYVVEGTDNIGVSHMPQVALAVEKGMPIVAVGSLLPRPAAAMIWLKRSGIDRVADLRGKTIAIPGLSFQREMLKAILSQAGVSPDEVKIIRVGYGLAPSLISGRADATFGGYGYVEGIELKSRGLEPVITPVTDLGVPPYEEMVWVTRADFAVEHPAAIRNFLAGVRRGNVAARKRPAAAARMLGNSAEAELQLSPKEMREGVRAATPLFSRSGRMSFNRANRFLSWMHDQGLIQRHLSPSALLTNRYLPKAGGS